LVKPKVAGIEEPHLFQAWPYLTGALQMGDIGQMRNFIETAGDIPCVRRSPSPTARTAQDDGDHGRGAADARATRVNVAATP